MTADRPTRYFVEWEDVDTFERLNPLAGVLAERRAKDREVFRVAVTDGLAQEYQRIEAEFATNKDAADLLGAAGWLDGHDTIVCLETEPGGCEWHRHHGASHHAPTLALAILAAARSLGWPGGGK